MHTVNILTLESAVLRHISTFLFMLYQTPFSSQRQSLSLLTWMSGACGTHCVWADWYTGITHIRDPDKTPQRQNTTRQNPLRRKPTRAGNHFVVRCNLVSSFRMIFFFFFLVVRLVAIKHRVYIPWTFNSSFWLRLEQSPSWQVPSQANRPTHCQVYNYLVSLRLDPVYEQSVFVATVGLYFFIKSIT